MGHNLQLISSFHPSLPPSLPPSLGTIAQPPRRGVGHGGPGHDVPKLAVQFQVGREGGREGEVKRRQAAADQLVRGREGRRTGLRHMRSTAITRTRPSECNSIYLHTHPHPPTHPPTHTPFHSPTHPCRTTRMRRASRRSGGCRCNTFSRPSNQSD